MPSKEARFYFDLVDPLSYVTELAIAELEAGGAAAVVRVGYELRPPPAPLTRSVDPFWAARCEAARLASPTLTLEPPALVPWTRKAHELCAFGAAHGAGDAVRRRVFEAYFREGRDIGRIDELLSVAVAVGLDRTETKVVLDVDRYAEEVREARRAAESFGIDDAPALLVGGKLVRGFHNPTDIGTLLGGSRGGGR